MKQIFDFLKQIGIQKVISILVNILSVVDKAFSCVEKIETRKENKEIDKKNSELEDICDKGTLDDLINFTKKMILILIIPITMLSGCKTNQIDVLTTKSWEGHYQSVQEFKEKTQDIKLDKKESIWVLSNQTLYSLLKQQKKDVK